MTDPDIYCTIAEFDGWEWVDGWHHPLYPTLGPPNYLTDLNAVNAVEWKLQEKEYADYALLVCGTVNHRPLSSSARQRAEALAKVIKEVD